MKIKPGFELRSVGGEEIVVASGVENIDFTSIISMNASSAMLWKSVEGREFTPETLAKLLTEHYEIDSATALEDVKEICTLWLKAGIIER